MRLATGAPGRLDWAEQILVAPAPSGKGLGAFAPTSLPAGVLVCSYAGEILTQREVTARYDKYGTGGDYLFQVREPLPTREGIYIDGVNSNLPIR